MKWVPGKKHQIADALSRAPLFHPDVEEGDEFVIDTARSCMVECRDPTLNVLFDAIDSSYIALRQAVLKVRQSAILNWRNI